MLEHLRPALPSTGEIMASVGHCHGMCWFAARAGRWDLAAYFLRRVRSLLRRLVVVRPKYTAQVKVYDVTCLEPLYQALLGRDPPGFEAAYRASVQEANALHVETGHPYVRWSTPTRPADDSLLQEP